MCHSAIGVEWQTAKVDDDDDKMKCSLWLYTLVGWFLIFLSWTVQQLSSDILPKKPHKVICSGGDKESYTQQHSKIFTLLNLGNVLQAKSSHSWESPAAGG